MADQELPKINLTLTPEVAEKLKGVLDKADESGENASITLQLTHEAHATFVNQLTQTPAMATAFIKNVPEEEEELPLPEEEEEEEETEEESQG